MRQTLGSGEPFSEYGAYPSQTAASRRREHPGSGGAQEGPSSLLAARALHPDDWENQIRGCVARLRALAGTAPDTPGLGRLIAELRDKSPDFAESPRRPDPGTRLVLRGSPGHPRQLDQHLRRRAANPRRDAWPGRLTRRHHRRKPDDLGLGNDLVPCAEVEHLPDPSDLTRLAGELLPRSPEFGR
ncbi:hypothetical protein [Streptomyces fulvoviolaceus]|uniref:MmyB family transcriptional regulator n=1 Tax=Streptomyces fulvoviolaceus TaxID=285535 RepID=UPI000996CB78